MSRYLLRDVLLATGGELRGEISPDHAFPRLERDTRHLQPGDLYIGIKGEVFDGNTFIPQAASLGAAAAIVARDWADQQAQLPLPLIVVEDTIQALQRWAAWQRDRLNITLVGITGSLGKTSAKESIAAVLSQGSKVYRSPGGFNNEIGLPLSIIEAEPGIETMVLEMGGAYAFGELTLLAGIAKPQVGVVTNVHPIHLERMGTIEAIAETKTELVEALPEFGLAILNGDDHRVRAMAQRTNARVIFYGLGEDNEVRAEDVSINGLHGTSFWLNIDGERTFVDVPFVGAHGVQIALVALAVGYGMGMTPATMLSGLQNRDVQIRVKFLAGPNGSQLIDDTYNASPPSVLSALGLLADADAKRRIAVLGGMRELGSLSEESHRQIGRRVAEVADVIITYGDLARTIAEEAALQDADRVIRMYDEHERTALIAMLHEELGPGDVTLLKGSRGLRMEDIVAAIQEDVVRNNVETLGA